jgi:hypothetical protein
MIWNSVQHPNGIALLHSIKENDGIAVYVPKETTLEEMAAKIEYVNSEFFHDLVQELSNRTS